MISDIAYRTDPGLEDLEFIGLYNPGDVRIILDSAHFTSGFSFIFPEGSSIGANEKQFITSNASSAFWSGKNAVVYQWISGRLADQGEKIQLSNKYDMVIDQVKFDILPPWPVPQNSLIGITLNRFDVDNHFGENWKLLSISKMFIGPDVLSANLLKVYPNPADDKLVIEVNDDSILTAAIYSSLGQLVKQIKLDANGETTIDVSNLQKGIYLIKAGKFTSKLIIAR
jgi:hypothetical protein